MEPTGGTDPTEFFLCGIGTASGWSATPAGDRVRLHGDRADATGL